MSQYSNLAIISWIQSTAGVPIAFAALAAAAHQEIANVGPRSPASCNIQRCESPASWEHPEIYCISYSHLQKVSKFCLLLCLLKWILNFVGHCFLAVDSLVFVEGFVD
ncbi:hypothetical protein BDL97_04G028300 [Sphagnum fallax]|nr:hypothetical protein BDL97_04G028300 [Sphagnum fallax]